MSSKLKRKIDELNVQNVNESFVQYGTPLPALTDTKRDAGEFLPLWQQEVRDEQGRRRLHGAFTGGFSAGYFNTVGSKEGWAPKTFRSSRADRTSGASAAKRTAEDFMDEEDLEDFRSTKTLQTDKTYDALSSQEPDPFSQPQSDSLADLVGPSKDGIGERLLKRMGWKEGQGVGPRISAQARRRQSIALGLATATIETEEDEEAQKHLFAPLDRPAAVYDLKENAYGLGFEKGISLHDAVRQGDHAGANTPEGKQRNTPVGGRTLLALPKGSLDVGIAGAFGIGALEEADEDDFSVYDNSIRLGAGTVIHEEGEDDNHYRPKVSKTAFQSKAFGTSHDYNTFNDGTSIISGFSLAKKIQEPDIWFTPPEIPRGWTPNPKRVLVTSSDPPIRGPPVPSNLRTGMTADDRRAILGEEALPAPAESVFDFISAKDKARLGNIRDNLHNADKVVISEPPEEEAVPLIVPRLEPSVASAALKGFLPFGDNLSKQDHYRKYLESQALLDSDVKFEPWARSGRYEELNKELDDFAKAARIFKPMSGAMASRFISGSAAAAAVDMKPSEPGLRQPTMTPADEKALVPAEKLEDDSHLSTAARAARNEMFGALTRKMTYFYPTKLLCKRFNVADPHPDGPTEDPNDKDLLNKETMDELIRESGGVVPEKPSPKPQSNSNINVPANSKEPPPIPLASVGLGEDETQGRDTLTYERPSMDLFKAIFADSDDDDEDEDLMALPSKGPTTEIIESEPPNFEPLNAESVPPWLRTGSAPESTKVKMSITPDEVDLAEISKPSESDTGTTSLNDFKPTFVPKAARSTIAPLEGDLSVKKSKSKRHGGLSFDMGDEGDESPVISKKSKKRDRRDENGHHVKKKTKSSKSDTIEEDEIWVEKETVVDLNLEKKRRKAADYF